MDEPGLRGEWAGDRLGSCLGVAWTRPIPGGCVALLYFRSALTVGELRPSHPKQLGVRVRVFFILSLCMFYAMGAYFGPVRP